EKRLKYGGQVQIRNYDNICRYDQPESGTTSIYVHLPTVMDQTAQSNVDYLKSLKNLHIDLVVFSSNEMHVNYDKIKKSGKPFEDLLKNYTDQLDNICKYLSVVCKSKRQGKQRLIWMKEKPSKRNMSDEEKQKLQDITNVCEETSERYGFKKFDRNLIWEKGGQNLCLEDSNDFSPL
ncbi:unnamed protein product, partial [Adineta steineri]